MNFEDPWNPKVNKYAIFNQKIAQFSKKSDDGKIYLKLINFGTDLKKNK